MPHIVCTGPALVCARDGTAPGGLMHSREGLRRVIQGRARPCKRAKSCEGVWSTIEGHEWTGVGNAVQGPSKRAGLRSKGPVRAPQDGLGDHGYTHSSLGGSQLSTPYALIAPRILADFVFEDDPLCVPCDVAPAIVSWGTLRGFGATEQEAFPLNHGRNFVGGVSANKVIRDSVFSLCGSGSCSGPSSSCCFRMKAPYSAFNRHIISLIGTSFPICQCAPLLRDKSLSAGAELPDRMHAKPLYPLAINSFRMVVPSSSFPGTSTF
mmetsp:Transcript_69958/g.116545  ORF Transcript_69958/g.116545 Transcript_69958/m.116545 type:complete len:266 (-) Transcript_69958:359-1156(-)